MKSILYVRAVCIHTHMVHAAPWYHRLKLRLTINVHWTKIYKTVTAVLYGCETWHITLMKEHRLRMSEENM